MYMYTNADMDKHSVYRFCNGNVAATKNMRNDSQFSKHFTGVFMYT